MKNSLNFPPFAILFNYAEIFLVIYALFTHFRMLHVK